MKLSKRQFLKTSLGGTAGLMLSRFLNPGALLAKPLVIPSNYLESPIHACWMRLSYNDGRESRQTRRLVGAALRHIGTTLGKQSLCMKVFDQGVTQLHQDFLNGAPAPGSLFALVQRLYDQHMLKQLGVEGGYCLFGTLLSLLRGLDGTERGQKNNLLHQEYRAAALEHKNCYLHTSNPKAKAILRQMRTEALQRWQEALLDSVESYAVGAASLDRTFLIWPQMFAGFKLEIDPKPVLSVVKHEDHIHVSWNGPAKLQYAPRVSGPWTGSEQRSPARFLLQDGPLFFRTVQE